MFTTCPACQTVFRVTAATLRAAHGQVRCATCNTAFDALFGLSDEPPAGVAGNVRSLAPAAAMPPPVEATRPVPVPAAAPTPPATVTDPEPLATALNEPELAEPEPAEPEPAEPELAEPEPAELAEPTEPTPPAAELLVDDLPANPSLDQVAAALADAGVLLEELDDPSALDEVTLVHIPGDPYPAITAGTPAVAQALAEDAARSQRRAATEAHPQPLPATQVELDDDAPTGTWAPLPLSATAALAPTTPVTEPPITDMDTAAEPSSFAAAMAAAAAPPATNLQGEPLWTDDSATAAATEADAEDALEPWMDDAQPVRRRGWAWTLGSVALVLVLAAQALHHWREPLARHPTLGSSVIALYAALGQPLSPALNLLAYSVRDGRVDAAAEAGALRVSAVITNRTSKAQLRPLLQVTLEDRYGAPIGRRTFHPEEYAPAPAIAAAGTPPAAIPLLIAPRGILPAMVEVADPGNEAVGFKLDICLEAAGVLHCSSDPADGSAASTP